MKHKILLQTVFSFAVLMLATSPIAAAQTEQGSFSLQVTPSPLVLSVRPGETITTELKIRNNGDKTEKLKIEPKSFNVDSENGKVSLNDSAPSDVQKWITFANPTFSVLPGQWFTERVTIALPKDSGFSYSFALMISRSNDASSPKPGETAVKGSIAVFTLISVDRPDAKRQIEVVDFIATKRVYEYLPAEFKTTLKNTGNTIVQPYGNIFVVRSKDTDKPISTLPVNEGKGYILPGSSRTLATQWGDGFPSYVQSKEAANSNPKNQLLWDWDKLSNFRFGKYTARLVAVYNDGSRDIPIESETSFWVIPWKLLLAAATIFIVIIIGIFTIFKKSFNAVRRPKKKHEHTEKTDK